MDSGNDDPSAAANTGPRSNPSTTGDRGRTAPNPSSGLLAAIDNALRDPYEPWHVPFGWLEYRTGIARLKLFFGLVCVTFTYLLSSGPGSALLGHAIGLTYPAFAASSVVMDGRAAAAVPVGDGSAAGPAVRWLVYWMLYSTAMVVEQSFVGRLILGAFPQWCAVRTLFFVWCQLPGEANGAALVYLGLRRYFGRFFSSDTDADEL